MICRRDPRAARSHGGVPEGVDAALVSRADFGEMIEKPDKVACRAILSDTLKALASGGRRSLRS
jgi:phage gp29-like protein